MLHLNKNTVCCSNIYFFLSSQNPKFLPPMCQISLMLPTVFTLFGLWLQAIGSLLSTQMYNLAQSPLDPAVLCLYGQAVRPLRHWAWEEKDRTTDWRVDSNPAADHQMGCLHAPVLFMWRDLGPVPASGSVEFLAGILSKPARHYRVKVNRSSPKRVKAKLKLKNVFFFFCRVEKQ